MKTALLQLGTLFLVLCISTDVSGDVVGLAAANHSAENDGSSLTTHSSLDSSPPTTEPVPYEAVDADDEEEEDGYDVEEEFIKVTAKKSPTTTQQPPTGDPVFGTGAFSLASHLGSSSTATTDSPSTTSTATTKPRKETKSKENSKEMTIKKPNNGGKSKESSKETTKQPKSGESSEKEETEEDSEEGSVSDTTKPPKNGGKSEESSKETTKKPKSGESSEKEETEEDSSEEGSGDPESSEESSGDSGSLEDMVTTTRAYESTSSDALPTTESDSSGDTDQTTLTEELSTSEVFETTPLVTRTSVTTQDIATQSPTSESDDEYTTVVDEETTTEKTHISTESEEFSGEGEDTTETVFESTFDETTLDLVTTATSTPFTTDSGVTDRSEVETTTEDYTSTAYKLTSAAGVTTEAGTPVADDVTTAELDVEFSGDSEDATTVISYTDDTFSGDEEDTTQKVETTSEALTTGYPSTTLETTLHEFTSQVTTDDQFSGDGVTVTHKVAGTSVAEDMTTAKPDVEFSGDGDDTTTVSGDIYTDDLFSGEGDTTHVVATTLAETSSEVLITEYPSTTLETTLHEFTDDKVSGDGITVTATEDIRSSTLSEVPTKEYTTADYSSTAGSETTVEPFDDTTEMSETTDESSGDLTSGISETTDDFSGDYAETSSFFKQTTFPVESSTLDEITVSSVGGTEVQSTEYAAVAETTYLLDDATTVTEAISSEGTTLGVTTESFVTTVLDEVQTSDSEISTSALVTESQPVTDTLTTTTTTTTTTTAATTTDDNETVVKSEFRIVDIDWDPALGNTSSAEYLELKSKMLQSLAEIFKDQPGFVKIGTITFREGSVVVEFDAVVEEGIDMEDLKDTFMDGMDNGALGNVTLDRDSVSFETEKEETRGVTDTTSTEPQVTEEDDSTTEKLPSSVEDLGTTSMVTDSILTTVLNTEPEVTTLTSTFSFNETTSAEVVTSPLPPDVSTGADASVVESTSLGESDESTETSSEESSGDLPMTSSPFEVATFPSEPSTPEEIISGETTEESSSEESSGDLAETSLPYEVTTLPSERSTPEEIISGETTEESSSEESSEESSGDLSETSLPYEVTTFPSERFTPEEIVSGETTEESSSEESSGDLTETSLPYEVTTFPSERSTPEEIVSGETTEESSSEESSGDLTETSLPYEVTTFPSERSTPEEIISGETTEESSGDFPGTSSLFEETTLPSERPATEETTTMSSMGTEQVGSTESVTTSGLVDDLTEGISSQSWTTTVPDDVHTSDSAVLTSVGVTKPVTGSPTTISITPTEPTDDGTVIKSDFRIVDIDWDPALGDTSSVEYRDLQQKMGPSLAGIYKDQPGFIKIQKMLFREGSVIVEYEAVFGNGQVVDMEELRDAFMEGVDNGALGNVTLDTDSVSFEADTGETRTVTYATPTEPHMTAEEVTELTPVEGITTKGITTEEITSGSGADVTDEGTTAGSTTGGTTAITTDAISTGSGIGVSDEETTTLSTEVTTTLSTEGTTTLSTEDITTGSGVDVTDEGTTIASTEGTTTATTEEITTGSGVDVTDEGTTIVTTEGTTTATTEDITTGSGVDVTDEGTTIASTEGTTTATTEEITTGSGVDITDEGTTVVSTEGTTTAKTEEITTGSGVDITDEGTTIVTTEGTTTATTEEITTGSGVDITTGSGEKVTTDEGTTIVTTEEITTGSGVDITTGSGEKVTTDEGTTIVTTEEITTGSGVDITTGSGEKVTTDEGTTIVTTEEITTGSGVDITTGTGEKVTTDEGTTIVTTEEITTGSGVDVTDRETPSLTTTAEVTTAGLFPRTTDGDFATSERKQYTVSITSIVEDLTTLTVAGTTVTVPDNIVIRSEFRIVDGVEWSERFENMSSPESVDLQRSTNKLLSDIYQDIPGFIEMQQMSFREGSVIVQSDAMFENSANFNLDILRGAFMQSLVNGTGLGPFTVDPDSVTYTVLDEKTTTTATTIKTSEYPEVDSYEFPTWAIASLIGAGFLIVFFMICGIVICCSAKAQDKASYAIDHDYPRPSESGSHKEYSHSSFGDKQDFAGHDFKDPIDLSLETDQDTPPTLRIRPDSLPAQGMVKVHSAEGGQALNGRASNVSSFHPPEKQHQVAPDEEAVVCEPVVHVSQSFVAADNAEADNAVAELVGPDQVYVIDETESGNVDGPMIELSNGDVHESNADVHESPLTELSNGVVKTPAKNKWNGKSAKTRAEPMTQNGGYLITYPGDGSTQTLYDEIMQTWETYM